MAGVRRLALVFLSAAALAAGAAGCGSSSSTSSGTATGNSAAATGTSGQTTSGGSAVGALSAEAKSAATGDIPDTQVFLTYTNPGAGYRISYPEGWTRKGSGANVTFSDKNNVIHIVVGKATTPTPAGLTAELNALKQSSPTLTFASPTTIQLKEGPAVKATYNTTSAPNPVTGKTVLLIVDRYELGKAGNRATVDLATPKGVDNVDAYRMIINSFRWQ